MSVSEMDAYHFDLLGYVRLEGALNADEVAALNGCIDAIPPLESGQWYGYVHGHNFEPNDGINYQQIYEAGEPFERLIDHLPRQLRTGHLHPLEASNSGRTWPSLH